MTLENFVRIVWTVEKIEKSRKMAAVFGLFLAIFGLILAMFLTFQSYDFDAFEHEGQNFMKIVWTVFEKFKIFIKRSGETKQKNDTIG